MDMMSSPRKKPATPVKVHLMTHRRSHSGESEKALGIIRNAEEKKDEQQEEKTQHIISRKDDTVSTNQRKTKKTPVKQALESAVILSNQGKYEDAVKELDRAIMMHPDLRSNVRLHINRGSYNFKGGLFDRALEDFDRALAIDDSVASVHFNKANVLKVLNRDEDALREFQRAAEIDPKLADAHAGAAQMLLRMKRFRHAVAAATRALEIDSNSFSALDAKVKALAKLGRTIEAVESVRALIRWYQSLARVTDNSLTAVPRQHRRAFARILEHAAERMPITDDAGLEFAKEAYALDEGYESCFELGNQYCARGLHAEAAKAYHRCCELDGSKSEVALLEGASLIQIGEYEKAIPPLKRALKLSEGQQETRFYLGLALLNLGRFSEAIPPLRRVVESNLHESDEILEKSRFLLASAYVHAGEEKRAFELLQVARRTTRARNNAEIHYQAGYAASLIGFDQAAKECFVDCLKIDPVHLKALAGLKKLEEKLKVLAAERAPSPPPLPPPPLVFSQSVPGPPPLPSPPSAPPRSSSTPTPKPVQAPDQGLESLKPVRGPNVLKPTVVVDPIALSTPSRFQPSQTDQRAQSFPSSQKAAKPSETKFPLRKVSSGEKEQGEAKTSSTYQKLHRAGIVSGAAAARSGTSTIVSSKASMWESRSSEVSASPLASASLSSPNSKSPSEAGAEVAQQNSASPKSSSPARNEIDPKTAVRSTAEKKLIETPRLALASGVRVPTSNLKPTTGEFQKVSPTSVTTPIAKQDAAVPVSSSGNTGFTISLIEPVSPQSLVQSIQSPCVPIKPAVVSSMASKPVLPLVSVQKDPVIPTKTSDNKTLIDPNASPLVPRDKTVSPLVSSETTAIIPPSSIEPITSGPTVEKPPATAAVTTNLASQKVWLPTTLQVPLKVPTVSTSSPEKGTGQTSSEGKKVQPPPLPAKRPSLAGRAAPPLQAKRPLVQRASSSEPETPRPSPANAEAVRLTTLTSPSKLSTEVSRMVDQLFGPPEGTDEDALLVRTLFETEGIERMADVALLTQDDLARIDGMKRAWCRRILKYVEDNASLQSTNTISSPSTPLSGVNTSPAKVEVQKMSLTQMGLLSAISQFEKAQLKTTSAEAPVNAGSSSKPLLDGIKQFERRSLRQVVKTPQSPTAVADASGFLGTILSAMRSRRVLLEDLEFGKGRDKSQSDVADDDMFEADWN